MGIYHWIVTRGRLRPNLPGSYNPMSKSTGNPHTHALMYNIHGLLCLLYGTLCPQWEIYYALTHAHSIKTAAWCSWQSTRLVSERSRVRSLALYGDSSLEYEITCTCTHIIVKLLWRNGQRIGLLIQRLRVRIPSRVIQYILWSHHGVVGNSSACHTTARGSIPRRGVNFK